MDAPSFRLFDRMRFGQFLDGVEFDEELVPDAPILADLNHVYVQVHNRGSAPADNVEVHLYYASTQGVSPPAVAPALEGAQLGFPSEPAPGSPWQRVEAPRVLGTVPPGNPVVVRFPWTPPLTLDGAGAALLALCQCAQDTPLVVPAAATAVDAFVQGERRAALRVVPTVSNPIFLRDGVDDDGRVGAVAWGGRSPDLVVVQTAASNPDVAFKLEPGNRRLADEVRPGDNFIYVRVHNRSAAPTTAQVSVYQVPYPQPERVSGWLQAPGGDGEREHPGEGLGVCRRDARGGAAVEPGRAAGPGPGLDLDRGRDPPWGSAAGFRSGQRPPNSKRCGGF